MTNSRKNVYNRSWYNRELKHDKKNRRKEYNRKVRHCKINENCSRQYMKNISNLQFQAVSG